MSIASLNLLYCILAALPIAAGPLDGRWATSRENQLTVGSAPILALSSDSLGEVYRTPAKTLLAFNGSIFDSLPVVASQVDQILINRRSDYWLMSTNYGVEYWNLPPAVIWHVVDGARKIPTGCLTGNWIHILGRDAQGRLILEEGRAAQYGPTYTALLRYSDQGCDTLEIGLKSRRLPVEAYARDSYGREYFSTQDMRDVPVCGPLIRLDQGKQDTLVGEACVTQMISVGTQALFSSSGGQNQGLWVTSDRGARKIGALFGKPLDPTDALFQDRQGVVWVGAGRGRAYAFHDQDTLLFTQENSGFTGNTVLGFAEDAEGNIWVRKDTTGMAIFVRGKSPLSLARLDTPRYQSQVRDENRNLLGRKIRLGPAASQVAGVIFKQGKPTSK